MQIPFRSFDLNVMKFGSVKLRNFSLKTATVPPPLYHIQDYKYRQ